MILRTLLCGLVIGLGSGVVPAQATTSAVAADHTPPAYDVVSIKVNPAGIGPWGFDLSEAKFSAKNISVMTLLAEAYDLNPEMISGVTGAVRSARFDVEAKVLDVDPGSLKKMSDDTRREMVRRFLEERFALKAHKETRNLPVYDLEVSRGGLKARASTPADGRGLDRSDRELKGHGVPMSILARALREVVKRNVIDKTGLADAGYELNLRWTPEALLETDAESGPSIFTAMQEQLGLKLVPAKGPVEALVVDHVEMPTEN